LDNLTFDTPASATCTGPCTGIWPPLLTSRQAFAGLGVTRDGLGILGRADGTQQVTYFGHGLPNWSPGSLTAAAGSGMAQAGLGTITRPDGTFQVTYVGHPLYFFALDQAGKTLGEGITAFGDTFKEVDLSGTPR
jgi:predicted lipoprotein with Yx(FWY)xxD motif